MSARDSFYQHLDQCDQCRNHPADLCLDGVLLMDEAMEESMPMSYDLMRWQKGVTGEERKSLAGRRE
jgi:hypothetical protein